MKTIITVAVAAIASLLFFNHRKAVDPAGTDQQVDGMLRSAVTVVTVAELAIQLLQVLTTGQKPRGATTPLRRPKGFGQTASEISGSEED